MPSQVVLTDIKYLRAWLTAASEKKGEKSKRVLSLLNVLLSLLFTREAAVMSTVDKANLEQNAFDQREGLEHSSRVLPSIRRRPRRKSLSSQMRSEVSGIIGANKNRMSSGLLTRH
jgi:hypothetical protein